MTDLNALVHRRAEKAHVAKGRRRRVPPLLRFVAGAVLVFLCLVLPAHPAGLRWDTLLELPLELPAILLAVLLLPGRLRVGFVGLVCLVLATATFLKLADLGTASAFSRPFNPLVDVPIMVAGWHLLTGSIGLASALAVIVLSFGLWIAAVLGIAWGLVAARHMLDRRRRAAAAALSLTLVAGIGLHTAAPRSATLDAGPFLTERLALMRKSIQDLALFNAALETDPLVDVAPQDRFSALAGRDVIILFVESYGRSVVEDPRYAEATLSRLADVETELSQAGYAIRSGWVTSPTFGGQSWLAHGALLSGLWTDNQARYDRMIASERISLNALFRENGWRSLAVMPAITMDWPEAGWFGYDAAYGAAALGYAGKPFNWVTMPDQYTLSAMQRLRDESAAPAMIEAALISSHAPWTPIPRLVPWDAVGDGRIFDEQASAGDPPSVVWADRERVRVQYAASIDYALETIGSYIARFGDDAVFIVLGDHQPAPIITGDGASHDVPMHVITRGDAVLSRLAGWDLTAGMVPDSDLAPMRMDAFREAFTRAMSGPAAQAD